MRISAGKRTPALLCAVFFILTAALLASGCAGTAVTETATAEEKVCRYKDTDPILKFKDEVLTYGEVKKIWAYSTSNENPDQFEDVEESLKEANIKQIAVNHLAAKRARGMGLASDNYYAAREYEMITRYMPAVYAEKVIGVEVSPTDAELLAMSPPALPEVVVRIFVAKEMDKAKEVYERIKSGEDMEALIIKESLGLSAQTGGQTRWMTVQNADKFPAPVVQKFLDAETGHVFEPFFQDVGFLVIRVEEKHSPEEVQQIWLANNRGEAVFKLRKEAFEARVIELVDKRKDVDFDNEKVRDILSGKLPKTEPVAKIKGMDFTLDILVPELMRMSSSHGEDKIANHLSKFIERAVVTEEAYSLGLDISDTTKEMIRVKGERNLSKLLKDKIARDAEEQPVTDEDMKKYVEENQADFTEPMRWCISLMEFDTQESAAEINVKVKAGEDFSGLAKVSGISAAKESSGAIGCYPKVEIPAEIYNVIEPMSKGQCSQEPFSVELKEGGDRWLLVQVYDVLNPSPVPFERVIKPIVEGRIKTQRRAKAMSELINSLADEYGYENCFIPNSGKENVSQ